MRIFKVILLLVALPVSGALAQHKAKPVVQPPTKRSEINKKDGKGRRQGMWLNIYPEKMNEAGYREFGNYNNDNKTGTWYKLDEGNNLLTIENYRNNVFDGEVRYFNNNVLTCVGVYKGLNPDNEIDTFVVEDPMSGKQELVMIPVRRGTIKHGTWRFYNEETGDIEKVEEYQADNLIYEEDMRRPAEDSARNVKLEQQMPHKKQPYYKPPVNKQVKYY